MEHQLEFEEIRPYRDEEVTAILAELVEDPAFMGLCRYFYPNYEDAEIKAQIAAMDTNLKFQVGTVYPAMQNVLAKSTSGFTSAGFDALDRNKSYVFISNHRDIILDPALLNYTLYENNFDTTEIAIGNNLLMEPWIEKLVRLNKSFIVHRDVQGRESLLVSQRLSRYIRSSVTNHKSSVWIAQKEGRTKDGDDKTQPSLLKMLNISGEGSLVDNFKELNIVPVSLSYEFDPCDVMKLWELQPEFAEITREEDLRGDMQNMITGVQGWKGHIHFEAGTPIHIELDKLQEITNKNEQFQALASMIDQQIYQHYKLFPCNYIAYDWLHNQSYYGDEGYYTEADTAEFEEYLEQRAGTIDRKIANLKEALLTMYAFPLSNHLKAQDA